MFQITLKFLEAVSLNNSTNRLHTYRDLYQQERGRFVSFVEKMLKRCKKIHPTLEGLDVKDCIYRFNKDLRFSKDQSPYKDHFGACFARGGKKSWQPCFYFHLQPGNKSMILGGVYYPSQKNEISVRKYLLMHFEEWRELISSPRFSRYFRYIPAEHQYKTSHKLKSLFVQDPELVNHLSPCLFAEGIENVFNSSVLDHLPHTEMIQTLVYNKDWIFQHPLTDDAVCSDTLLDDLLRAYKLFLPVLQFFENAYDET